jgi:hypothetical protein
METSCTMKNFKIHQNDWVSVFSIVQNSKYQRMQHFGKDLFLSSCEERETPTLSGLLEQANFNHLRMETDPV